MLSTRATICYSVKYITQNQCTVHCLEATNRVTRTDEARQIKSLSKPIYVVFKLLSSHKDKRLEIHPGLSFPDIFRKERSRICRFCPGLRGEAGKFRI